MLAATPLGAIFLSIWFVHLAPYGWPWLFSKVTDVTARLPQVKGSIWQHCHWAKAKSQCPSCFGIWDPSRLLRTLRDVRPGLLTGALGCCTATSLEPLEPLGPGLCAGPNFGAQLQA